MVPRKYETVMILTSRGRKCGKLHRTPIGYFLIGGVDHLFSAWGKSAGWYRNLTAHPDQVEIQIGLRRRKVRAEVITSVPEIRRTLEQLIAESPQAAACLFGWDAGTDRMESSDFSAIVARVLIVRFP